VRIGLIIGTGVDFGTSEQWPEVRTPYGPAYAATIPLGGTEVVLLRRHGPGHNVPPHLINYRANLWALRQAGVERVLATAAVGSMRKEMPPGSMAVVGDFIDFTKSRDATIFDRPGERVVHIDFSTPYCPEVSAALEQAAAELGIRLERRLTYVCVDGPRYETPAEIRMFAQWGGDVVGMTGVPEVVLAREMGMCYGGLAVLANYAAGIGDGPLSHEEVIACVGKRRQDIQNVLERAVTIIPTTRGCCSLP